MKKFCPVCSREYPDDLQFCSEDRTALVVSRPDESEDLVGRILVRRFEIMEKIGQGGMGAVYRARQLSMQRDVAIKVLKQAIGRDPVAIKRFFKEAQAASQLRHAHTITVFDFGQAEDELLFIVMELLQGQPLSRAIAQDGPFPPTRAVAVLAQVCDALTEAHKQGIIHRDLKPDNIFLMDQEGTPDFVKVLDFGIAKVPSKEGESALTVVGQVVGTPAYMSPEHAMGLALTPQSDLYSLGVILYEMLAGVAPYRSSSPMALLLAHLQQPVPSLRQVEGIEVPDALDRMLQRAMAKRSEDRPASAPEFKSEMLAAVQEAAGSTYTVPLRPIDGYKGTPLPFTAVPAPAAPENAPAKPVPAVGDEDAPTRAMPAGSISVTLAVAADLPTVAQPAVVPGPLLSTPTPNSTKIAVVPEEAVTYSLPELAVSPLPPDGLPAPLESVDVEALVIAPGRRRLIVALVVLLLAAGIIGVVVVSQLSHRDAGPIVSVEAVAPVRPASPQTSGTKGMPAPPASAAVAAAQASPANVALPSTLPAEAASTRPSASDADTAAAPSPAAAPRATALPPPPESALTIVKVRSQPAGARVTLDERVLGTTPFDWNGAQRGRAVKLVFRRAGSAPRELAVTPGQQPEVTATLAPAPPPARPVPGPQPKPKPKKGALTGWEE